MALVAGIAGEAFAQAGTPLVGVWGVVATPRNCATNAALGPPLRSLLTFHQDGTAFESIVLLLFAPGQRTIGHGTWTHGGGATYTDNSVVIVGFDTPPNTPPGSPGFPAGWVVSSSTITMIGADRFESTGTTRFFDVNRLEYRPASCSSRVAERFK
jgi:hypothetical protein